MALLQGSVTNGICDIVKFYPKRGKRMRRGGLGPLTHLTQNDCNLRWNAHLPYGNRHRLMRQGMLALNVILKTCPLVFILESHLCNFQCIWSCKCQCNASVFSIYKMWIKMPICRILWALSKQIQIESLEDHIVHCKLWLDLPR